MDWMQVMEMMVRLRVPEFSEIAYKMLSAIRISWVYLFRNLEEKEFIQRCYPKSGMLGFNGFPEVSAPAPILDVTHFPFYFHPPPKIPTTSLKFHAELPFPHSKPLFQRLQWLCVLGGCSFHIRGLAGWPTTAFSCNYEHDFLVLTKGDWLVLWCGFQAARGISMWRLWHLLSLWVPLEGQYVLWRTEKEYASIGGLVDTNRRTFSAASILACALVLTLSQIPYWSCRSQLTSPSFSFFCPEIYLLINT